MKTLDGLKLFMMGVIVCTVGISPSTASANCPNKIVSGKYGQLGHQGTCWHWKELSCKPCGPKHFPGGIEDWEAMPKVVRNKCMAKTIKHRLDGCSVPLKDPASKDFKHVLKGACNAHDICYHSSAAKGRCDSNFHQNMVHECDRYYSGIINSVMHSLCIDAANVWASAVWLAGMDAYKADQKWAKKNDCL